VSEHELYIFDVDGTLIRSFLREGAPREEYDRVEALPGRVEKLHELHLGGAKLALATNQGGVAFGYQTEEQVARKLAAVLALFEVPMTLHVAYGHPKATVTEYRKREHVRRRKPSCVMLVDAMFVAGVPPARAMFVGDHDTDEEAARRAGCAYRDAEEFFA
jgi:D-glycero-D-manno-heptose 1,7-bisphosphate phosphatase